MEKKRIDGKTWYLFKRYRSKVGAKKTADSLRKRSAGARVVPSNGKWAVFYLPS